MRNKHTSHSLKIKAQLELAQYKQELADRMSASDQRRRLEAKQQRADFRAEMARMKVRTLRNQDSLW
jgi:hypothetical protein